MNNYKFNISKHARQRYIERILCGSNSKDNLLIEILNQLRNSQDITNKIFDETPRYILFLYEKYNCCKLTILQHKDILFICRKQEGTDNMLNIVTCYNSHNHLSQFKNSSLSREDVFLKIKIIKKEVN